MIPPDTHLQIGSLVFDGMDQIDLTGPFEVLSRLPNATCRLYGKTIEPVRDINGLSLVPDATLAAAPSLDVLHVPGGHGQEALMEDADVLNWIRKQAQGARALFSVCTGALLCGAAGLLQGRRATTHWASFHLLPFFGAVPVNQRVVIDGAWVFAAGVTAGIDGALRLAAELRGDAVAQTIQLSMAYAPEPPFDSGTPETAPAAILEQARRSSAAITARREHTARRIAARLGTLRPSSRRTTMTHDTTTMTFTRTQAPDWLMAFWKEIDDKTFGKGFDCFTRDAICRLGVAQWNGREAIRENLRAFIDTGFSAFHEVLEYWDGGSLKVFRGIVTMTPEDHSKPAVKPVMTHFFYMDEADPTKVRAWYGSVGPIAF